MFVPRKCGCVNLSPDIPDPFGQILQDHGVSEKANILHFINQFTNPFEKLHILSSFVKTLISSATMGLSSEGSIVCLCVGSWWSL